MDGNGELVDMDVLESYSKICNGDSNWYDYETIYIGFRGPSLGETINFYGDDYSLPMILIGYWTGNEVGVDDVGSQFQIFYAYLPQYECSVDDDVMTFYVQSSAGYWGGSRLTIQDTTDDSYLLQNEGGMGYDVTPGFGCIAPDSCMIFDFTSGSMDQDTTLKVGPIEVNPPFIGSICSMDGELVYYTESVEVVEVIKFSGNLTLGGFVSSGQQNQDGSVDLSDEEESVLSGSLAEVMDIDEEEVEITNAWLTSSRRRLLNGRRLQQGQELEVEFEVTSEVESDHDDEIQGQYDALNDALTNAVASGELSEAIEETAIEDGVDSLEQATADSIEVVSFYFCCMLLII